jgi:endonuclease YncB( thermonuclease family)
LNHHFGYMTSRQWLAAIALIVGLCGSAIYLTRRGTPPPAAPEAGRVPARSQPTETAQVEQVSARVVGVSDGDTIGILYEGHREPVRLSEIDCPEYNQAFGTRAKLFTSDLVFGRTVTIRTAGRDRYGRILAEVMLPDGRSLNRELVRAGLAWRYRGYSSDESLGALEAEARAARRGLWSDAHPVPPWEFRRR